jgi:CBS domain-containing protein
MMIRQLISNDFTPIKIEDTVQFALVSMEELGVMNLPVVSGSILKGYVKSTEMEALDPEMLISDLDLKEGLSLNPDVSLFHAIQLFALSQLDLVAVCLENNFLGTVWLKDLVGELGRSATTQNEGAVLILRCTAIDYSISELGRVIESSDGKMLGLWTWQTPGNRSIDLMVKLNILQIDNLLLLLQAHGYKVLHTVNNHKNELTLERYQSLLKYLDL